MVFLGILDRNPRRDSYALFFCWTSCERMIAFVASSSITLLANIVCFHRHCLVNATSPCIVLKVADTKKRTADISAAKKLAKQHDQVLCQPFVSVHLSLCP